MEFDSSVVEFPELSSDSYSEAGQYEGTDNCPEVVSDDSESDVCC